MKRIFRSIINIKKTGKPTIEQQDLVINYRSFLASKIKPEDPSYIKLYHWIEAHHREYKEIPAFELLYEKAQGEGEEAVLSSLEELIKEVPYIQSDYRAILKGKFEEQSKEGFKGVVENTWKIVNSGVKVGKKELKGLPSAIEYFVGESRKYRFNESLVKTESEIRSVEDGSEVIGQYRQRKKDPMAAYGMYTLIDHIDEVARGLKPGHFMMVAAFVGQGKTTVTANLVYNGIMQGMNGLFVAMEMNFDEMRDLFFTLHTSNPEWYDHPKYKKMAGKILYERVRYAELSAEEQEFFEASSNDFVTQSKFGKLFLYQPSEALTPSKLEMLIYDYNVRLMEQGRSLDFVAVDYLGLMVPDKNERYGDWNIDLNNIIKKLKNIAINFDNGRGIRMISPFQTNRNGFKEAEKNDGVYSLTALSNANESERACDLIVSLYMSSEMKKNGIMKIGCLKHRHGADFVPFEAHMNFPTKRLENFIQQKTTVEGNEMTINEIALDVS